MAIDRYHRQTLLPQLGTAGQARLSAASAVIVGCGALGCSSAELLARAGVGKIRIVDRDIVELTNLQRQVLFDEEDATQSLPKAVAARDRLAKINSSIQIEARVADLDGSNVESLVAEMQIIIDGTDNVATRYLLNDASLKFGRPWIYGACVGSEGRMLAVFPDHGPCLRCLFPTPPNPADLPACDTAGVLGPVAAMVGALQATAAIKIFSGNASAVAAELVSFDLWNNRIHATPVADAKRSDCPACALRQFEFLQSRDRDLSARLCGRNAVQVRASLSHDFSLSNVAARLQSAGAVSASPYMVRCQLAEGGLSLTAFEDGRVIVQGTNDPARARSIVARYVGT